MRLGVSQKSILLIVLLAGVVLLQYSYDLARPAAADVQAKTTVSPEMIRMLDMGFHSAVASFLWAGTMPEILDLFRHRAEYIPDVAYVNAVDPKLSYPYAFSVLTLPAVPTQIYADGFQASVEIGQRGIAEADPDWRIPYYMATNYFLSAKDKLSAAKYYDIAAQTPGIPDFAKRFSLNFGVSQNIRAQTIQLWTTIRDSTKDEFTKERAQAYIDHLSILDYLDAASAAYKKKFGAFPTDVQSLVTKNIIPAIPEDPFGFTFTIEPKGTAGIDLSKFPPGFTSSTPPLQ